MEATFDFTMVKKHFHVSPEGAEFPVYQTAATNLFRPALLREALSESGSVVQATSLALPASFMGISLCRLSLVQLLFAAAYNRLIDLSPENLIYQVELYNKRAYLGYRIKEVRSVAIPSVPGDRDAFMARHWQPYFTEFVTPALERIAAAADLKAEAIWQQFGGQASHLKAFIQTHEPRAEIVAQLLNDCERLGEMPAEWFNRRRNPYPHKPRYVENPLRAGESWMLKSSCCLYDRRENGKMCYTCPRMTAEAREQRKCELLAAAETASAGAASGKD